MVQHSSKSTELLSNLESSLAKMRAATDSRRAAIIQRLNDPLISADVPDADKVWLDEAGNLIEEELLVDKFREIREGERDVLLHNLDEGDKITACRLLQQSTSADDKGMFESVITTDV